MFSMHSAIELCSCRHYDKVCTAYELLNVGVSHQSEFLNKFGRVSYVPFIGVNLIAVCNCNVKIVVETKSINFETVHVHSNFKETSNLKPLISRNANFIDSFVVCKDINLTENDLIISN